MIDQSTDDGKFLYNLAKECYEEYGNVTDFKNFRGDTMPSFDDLPDVIKSAWIAASKHAFNYL